MSVNSCVVFLPGIFLSLERIRGLQPLIVIERKVKSDKIFFILFSSAKTQGLDVGSTSSTIVDHERRCCLLLE